MKTAVLMAFKGAERSHVQSDQIDALKNGLGIPVLELRGCTQIDIGRSYLATVALQHGAEVVVFIDDDMEFVPGDVPKLADVVRETRGVAGAPYSPRKMGAPQVGGFDSDLLEAGFFASGGLYLASGVIGMGFTAIHRDVFERLDALPEYAVRRTQDGPVRPYFKKLVVDGFWLHEDASFCHAARQVGVITQLDTRIRVKHVGAYRYGIEDCLRKLEDTPGLTVRLRAEPLK